YIINGCFYVIVFYSLSFFFYSYGVHRYLHSFPTRRSSDLAKGALTYTDIAGDPVLYGNLPPREISMKDVFRSGDSSKKFHAAAKIGERFTGMPRPISYAVFCLKKKISIAKTNEPEPISVSS